MLEIWTKFESRSSLVSSIAGKLLHRVSIIYHDPLLFLNSDSFGQQPAVINGCSDLFIKVFGEKGSHARSAVGTNSLPFNVAVEIEAIFDIEE